LARPIARGRGSVPCASTPDLARGHDGHRDTQDTKSFWDRWIEMLPTDVCVGAVVAVELLAGSLGAMQMQSL
jgi:hypothetical protein